jgi:adenosylmethionine-8-amino-7-oxononanoate aminotransferase
MRGDLYQFAPPYVASEAEIDRMVNILGEAIVEVLGN